MISRQSAHAVPAVGDRLDPDPARDEVVLAFQAVDPSGERVAKVIRQTFDQLYDGQRTGRYRWDQLYKTEKTHCGTLIEINLRREFTDIIEDGSTLDYRIRGHEIDCKYSQQVGGWMLPPECFGQLLLVASADDLDGVLRIGVVRASDSNRSTGANRDRKSTLNTRGRKQISWIHVGLPLPPNVLLQLDNATISAIMQLPNGQARINELLRRVTERRIGRNTIATVAQQDDYMKRIRGNGGARSHLRNDGYLIPGGDYTSHQRVATALGLEAPGHGEVVSVRVVPTEPGSAWSVELDGAWWRKARPDEVVTVPAPYLPAIRKS